MRGVLYLLGLGLGLVVLWPVAGMAQSVIVPDDSLGEERSQVVPDADDTASDRIVGGARRGPNLFHSFEAFNVAEGRGAFFASPAGLDHIFSRVTGTSPSEILGTLGVDGAADLFFLNPNGIIFGANSSLDIEGSFSASTASSIIFADGTEFDAVTPDASTLLTVSVPLGLQYGSVPPGSTLTNRGVLNAGQDLSLTADSLDLQGQLVAGNDLTLQATDSLQIRDTAAAPFVAESGGAMVLQGAGALDIAALSHPDSGLVAGGDLTLRSAAPVIGDAHYWSGGDFRIETMSGGLGVLTSPNDPVLRVAGDVTFDSYSGASLHIFAGGSVTIPGTIEITGADPVNGLVETVSLSNGSTVVVDGQTRPTLDIRAGTLAVGPLGVTGDGSGFTGAVPATGTTATSADITIGQIDMADDGLVLLTNQYVPDTTLAGGEIQLGAVTAPSSIGGDSLVVDSRDRISATGNINVSTFGVGEAGDVVMLAENDVVLDGANIRSVVGRNAVGTSGSIEITANTIDLKGGSDLAVSTVGQGNAGSIQLSAIESVTLSDNSDLFSLVNGIASGNGGSIEITTQDLTLTDRSDILVVSNGEGDAGSVDINASGSVIADEAELNASTNGGGDGGTIDITADAVQLNATKLSAEDETVGPSTGGTITIDADSVELLGETLVDVDGGDVEITGRTIAVGGDSLFSVRTVDEGGRGNLTITATESVVFSGDSDAVVNVSPTTSGDGGNIEITTNTFELLGGSDFAASTNGDGNAGNIQIIATESVLLDGSNLLSRVNRDRTGNGGNIEITTQTYQMVNNSDIIVDSDGNGNAGNIIINATTFEARGLSDLQALTSGDGNGGSIIVNASESALFAEDSDINSIVLRRAVGNGGNVEITTGTLILTGDSEILASTNGEGNAGNIQIVATESVLLEDGAFVSRVNNENAIGQGGNIDITTGTFEMGKTEGAMRDESVGLFVSTIGTGNAGNITLNVDSFEAQDSTLEAFTGGMGNAGNIIINASGFVLFANDSDITNIVRSDGIGDGGNLEITANALEFQGDSNPRASTVGQGDAGNILIVATESVLIDNSDFFSIVNEEASGDGGSIEITTTTLEVLNGSELFVNTNGNGNAGSIVIDASESVVFANDSDATANVSDTGIGDGGSITITTGILELFGDSELFASTSGQGDAGDIIITATDRVTFNGSNDDGPFPDRSDPESDGDAFTESAALSQVDATGTGNGGNIKITAPILEVLDGAVLTSSTLGTGNAGNVIIAASDRVVVNGVSGDGELASSIATSVEPGATGDGGNISVTAPVLRMLDGGQLTAGTSGQGDAGSVTVTASDRIILNDLGSDSAAGGIFTIAGANSSGEGGPINLSTQTLSLLNGAVINARTENALAGGNVRVTASDVALIDGGQIITTTLNEGQAGSIVLNADTITLSGSSSATATSDFSEGIGQSGLFSSTRDGSTGPGGNITVGADALSLTDGAVISAQSDGGGSGGSIVLDITDSVQLTASNVTTAAVQGEGGDIRINTGLLALTDRAVISAQSEGQGAAGRIILNTIDSLQLTNSDITTTAAQSSGGDIRINVHPDSQNSVALLIGDGDITTNSFGNGGNIKILGAGIIAFDDSDIISSSGSARGGNITLNTFLSEPTPPGNAIDFDNNGQVDVNASGAIASGTITAPDTSFIQNSLAALPEGILNTDALIANSCVARSEDGGGTFTITGSEGLPERPSEGSASQYPTGDVQPIPNESSQWEVGDPIIEAQALYRLPNGALVISHACSL